MPAAALRIWRLAAIALPLFAQEPSPPAPAENWNLLFQATSIGQNHNAFPALYSGPLSLATHREAEVSITWTLFAAWRPARDTLFVFNPEVAGGRAFSNTTGVANFPNGEMPRVATAMPKPYIARLYVTQEFPIGPERVAVDADENQPAGSRPVTGYSITVGRFTVTDFFDDNRYSHDPRTQFMGWAIMYNGAWDYPADTRGYTWGWVHEFHTRDWSFRYGAVAMPLVANGLRFDRRVLVDRGDVFEAERRGKIHGHDGAARLLSYFNHGRMGNYAESVRLAEQTGTTPDITATRKPGTLKYGFGLSLDQELAKDTGVFTRLGWNDGRTESFCFTPIDRLASFGVSVNGNWWKRPKDTAATALTMSGISGVHRLYLERGGLDFLLGDGALRYGLETISESYYSAQIVPWLFATVDLQHINNPAYNRDRGPVWAGSLRLHMEFGKR